MQCPSKALPLLLLSLPGGGSSTAPVDATAAPNECVWCFFALEGGLVVFASEPNLLPSERLLPFDSVFRHSPAPSCLPALSTIG